MYPKAIINGLNDEQVQLFLILLDEKVTNDEEMRFQIEVGGNDAEISWIKDGMDISGDDTIHLLFELYGTSYDYGRSKVFDLLIGNRVFTTDKYDENWLDKYTEN